MPPSIELAALLIFALIDILNIEKQVSQQIAARHFSLLVQLRGKRDIHCQKLDSSYITNLLFTRHGSRRRKIAPLEDWVVSQLGFSQPVAFSRHNINPALPLIPDVHFLIANQQLSF
ncbi:hypothetical protein LOB20_09715 [Lactobacillus delbrueckii subsp. lactis]|nr:hypothetical protein [Lactobacillus delbrueckii]MCD5568227.1 hypothetical protein [Lactobacillus delbrueckii subsp. lactis]